MIKYYINTRTKVIIICNICGCEFMQKPHDHLNKHGCPNCFGKFRKTNFEFIKQAQIIHGNRYNYELVEYVNCDTKVKIICTIHGQFYQTPHNQIIHKIDCPKCVRCGYSKLSIQFINELVQELKVNIQHAENTENIRYMILISNVIVKPMECLKINLNRNILWGFMEIIGMVIQRYLILMQYVKIDQCDLMKYIRKQWKECIA